MNRKRSPCSDCDFGERSIREWEGVVRCDSNIYKVTPNDRRPAPGNQRISILLMHTLSNTYDMPDNSEYQPQYALAQ